MATVDELTIKIGADFKGAVRGINKVDNATKRMAKSTVKSLGKFSSSVAKTTLKIGAMTAAVSGAVIVYAGLSKAIQQVDQVMGDSGWSRTLGISLKSFHCGMCRRPAFTSSARLPARSSPDFSTGGVASEPPG